jgi:hypothetical protein
LHLGGLEHPGNHEDVDPGSCGIVCNGAQVRPHHRGHPLVDPPRLVQPQGVDVDPLQEIRPALGASECGRADESVTHLVRVTRPFSRMTRWSHSLR